MTMSASARTEALEEMAPVQEHCGNPGVAPLPQEVYSGEQSRHRNPVGPSDGAGFPTFIDGAGI
jgi:hypothetical protein